jgi:hypothetical protein
VCARPTAIESAIKPNPGYLPHKSAHYWTSAWSLSDTTGRPGGGGGGGRTRETERGSPCRPIETEVNRDSGSTYDRVSFLGYVPPED